jgi:hypothetical protein
MNKFFYGLLYLILAIPYLIFDNIREFFKNIFAYNAKQRATIKREKEYKKYMELKKKFGSLV